MNQTIRERCFTVYRCIWRRNATEIFQKNVCHFPSGDISFVKKKNHNQDLAIVLIFFLGHFRFVLAYLRACVPHPHMIFTRRYENQFHTPSLFFFSVFLSRYSRTIQWQRKFLFFFSRSWIEFSTLHEYFFAYRWWE
jgi:hypothetical protein